MLVDARNYQSDHAYCAYLVEKLVGTHEEAQSWLATRLGCEIQRLKEIQAMTSKATYLEQYALESLLAGISNFRRNYMGKRSASPVWSYLIRETRASFVKIWRQACSGQDGPVDKNLGYSPGELRSEIESKFQGEMSWSAYPAWEVDHIQPVCSFNLWEPDIDRKVHALSNLTPLWKKENQSKGSRSLVVEAA